MGSFCEEDQVEIIGHEEGFRGSYYEAKIIKQTEKEDEYLIEYKELKEDEKEEDKEVTEEKEDVMIQEIVNVKLIRPLPPQVEVSKFKVGDEVDVWALDGWWVGTVTRVSELRNKFTGTVKIRCYVWFEKSSKTEVDYQFDKLRVHQEWTDNGSWVQQEKKTKNKRKFGKDSSTVLQQETKRIHTGMGTGIGWTVEIY